MISIVKIICTWIHVIMHYLFREFEIFFLSAEKIGIFLESHKSDKRFETSMKKSLRVVVIGNFWLIKLSLT